MIKTCDFSLAALVVTAVASWSWCDDRSPAATANADDETAKMAGWYKPGHFDGSTFYLIASSHNDIAYLDDPRGTADFRAENLIGPALDLMRIDDSFALDIESTLFLKEFLARCPERIDEVRQRVAEQRLSFGGRYTQFYEAVFGGEALARQMYFGRKWLKKTLGENCDTHIVWDTDVPQRTLQSPQVFAKSGIKYLMIGRFPHPGVFLWESPDGSNVIFHTYLYAGGWGLIPGAAVPAGTPTTKYVFDLLESQRALFETSHLPNFGSVTMSDYSCPGLDLVRMVKAFNKDVDALKLKGLNPPHMQLATAATYLASVEQAKPFLKKYQQDWPNPWGYHHQPSHERVVSAARRGYNDLVTAEKFALIASLLDAEESPYPRARLNEGWEGLIHPDHGWCGEKTLETIRVFQERLQTACDVGRDVRQRSLNYIARRVQRNKRFDTALVVFNPLSWKRTGPVSSTMDFHEGQRLPTELGVVDAQGCAVPCQTRVESSYADGSVRRAAIDFIAADVPSIGYKTYYLAPVNETSGTVPGVVEDNTIENAFYRIALGERGIASLIDKESGAEVFDTQKFLAGEVFMLGVDTAWGNSCFDYTFYPDNRRSQTLPNLGRLPGALTIESCETGAVKTVVTLRGSSPEMTVRQTITLYHPIKRIDFAVQLDWKGIRKRDVRLAFPIQSGARPQVSYDVPFGVVEMGKNEMGSAAPREVQNFIDVTDGERGVTLAVGSNCVHDFRDLTTDPMSGPLLQPVLLCTLLDLEIPGVQQEHPWWTQPGHHAFDFALTTHAGTWRDNWRFGWEFNNPLQAIVARDCEDADPLIDRYVTSDPPEQRKSALRERTYGILPEELSFCSVEPANIVISALKQCDDDDSIVVRYFDMEGKDVVPQLHFFCPIASVQLTNLIEEEGRPVAGEGQTLPLPSGAYSIDTVKMTRRLMRHQLATLPHRDAMEYADQPAATSVWKRYTSYRDLTLSAEQNHTPDGKTSLKSGGLLDFAYMRLPAMTNLSLEVWFYDSGEPDTFGAVIAAPSSPSDPTGSAEFGIFPTEKLGGHSGGATHYSYYTGTGDWDRQNSGIARSKGWHKVVFEFTPAGGAIRCDDKLVTASPNMTLTRLLFLGNPWGGTQPMYFDDVSVVALPDAAGR